uniref:Uncharacterized protein n=1 Tax=Romanomermis culicivorax TaxID=13658 RepID=A0A915KAA2_ROMCU
MKAGANQFLTSAADTLLDGRQLCPGVKLNMEIPPDLDRLFLEHSQVKDQDTMCANWTRAKTTPEFKRLNRDPNFMRGYVDSQLILTTPLHIWAKLLFRQQAPEQ